MTGHEALRAMRHDSRAPRCVWITDGDDIRAKDWHHEINQTDQQRHAVISLAAGDIPEALDLRCFIGLEVHISGERGEARSNRLHNAVIEAKAKRVITSIHAPEGVHLLTYGI
jgi:hypothetical protein